MNLRELLAELDAIVQQMRDLVEHPAGSDGDMTEDQAARFDQLKIKQAALEQRIERAKHLDALERRMAGQQVAGTGDRQLDRMRRDFSLVRALAAASGLEVDDGLEREVQQEIRANSPLKFKGVPVPVEVFDQPIEQRVTTAGGSGANLIATDHLGNQFIDRLREKIVVRRLGARVLRGLVGDISIPKLSASPPAQWVAENGAISAADATWAAVTMDPKHAGVITELSRNMLLQSSPDIENLVRDDFAQLLAAALDEVALNGGGSDEPDGLLSITAIQNSAIDMSTPTWAKIQQLISSIDAANSEGTGFVCHPMVLAKLRTTLKESGDAGAGYLAEAGNIDGYTLLKSTQLPVASPDSSALLFGNWSDLLIGFWSELDILVNPYESTAYSKGNVQIRAMLTADVAVRHTESFSYGSTIPH